MPLELRRQSTLHHPWKTSGTLFRGREPSSSWMRDGWASLCFVKSWKRAAEHDEGNQGPIFCKELRKTTMLYFHFSQLFNFTSESVLAGFMPVLSGNGGRQEVLFLEWRRALRILNLRRMSANINPQSHSPHTADGQKLIVKAVHGAIYQWPL